MYSTGPTHLIFLDLITLIMFDLEVSHPPVTYMKSEVFTVVKFEVEFLWAVTLCTVLLSYNNTTQST